VVVSTSSVDEVIRSRRELLDAMLRHFPGGSINVFDHDLLYLYGAGAGRTWLGFEPTVLIGKRLDDLFPEGVIAEIRTHCRRVFAGETVTFTLSIFERKYSIRAWPFDESDGAIRAIVAMAQEVPTLSSDGHEGVVWHPRVGNRVRIRAAIQWTSMRHGILHDPAEEGCAGIVVDDQLRTGFRSHQYLVAFDEPVPIIHTGIHVLPLHRRHYAANELEPIG